MTVAGWLESIAGFDPQRWFALMVCTNRKRHDPQVVGVLYDGPNGLMWSPYTRELEPGEAAEALSETERAEILEWTQYVATEDIYFDGVLAFLTGDPVPTSHVQREVVNLDQVESREPAWPSLSHVAIQRTRLDADRVRELRLAGVQGWAAQGRGSLNVICPEGCTLRMSRDDFDKLTTEARRVEIKEVDVSRYC